MMILKGIILFASIIFSALLMLLSLALLVVGLVKKQSALRTFGLAILLSSTCLFAFTTVYTGSKAWTVAQSLWVSAKGTAAKVALWWEGQDFLTFPKPSRHILLLQSYVPEETLKTINPEYYAYFGFSDWWRFPLVYPYSIQAIDNLDDGYLINERDVDYPDVNRRSINVGISDITHLALDRNYLLLRTQSREYPTGSSIEIKYILFTFSTGKWIEFGSDSEMFAKARELGFTGELRLITIDEYANLCYY